jgi:hypothetical protein
MRLLQSFAIFLFLFSCSYTQKLALKSAGDVFEEGSHAYYRLADWDELSNHMGANILQLEAFYSFDPTNTIILSQLVKAYSGLAYGYYETMALEEIWLDLDRTPYKNQAIYYYNKALYYGEKYLALKNVTIKDLLAQLNQPEKLKVWIDEKFSKSDISAVFYTAQAWGGYLNLNRSQSSLMSHIAGVKALIDWACEENPNLDFGNCYMVQAMFEASRSKAMGGNPDKSRKLLETLKHKYPQNYLADIVKLQILTIPAGDTEEFDKMAKDLDKKLEKWQANIYQISYQAKNSFDSDTNLYNLIAQKRFAIMKKIKNKIL